MTSGLGTIPTENQRALPRRELLACMRMQTSILSRPRLRSFARYGRSRCHRLGSPTDLPPQNYGTWCPGGSDPSTRHFLQSDLFSYYKSDLICVWYAPTPTTVASGTGYVRTYLGSTKSSIARVMTWIQKSPECTIEYFSKVPELISILICDLEKSKQANLAKTPSGEPGRARPYLERDLPPQNYGTWCRESAELQRESGEIRKFA
jgi:hypothetical protein